MAEPFRTTPAMRVFGAGLPTFRGTPILASRDRLSPQLRQNALEEDQIRNEEAQIGLQQRQLERQFQIQDAENAAFEDLQKGEEIGNVFRKNPALAMSPHFRNLAMMQPSRATQSLSPSLSMKLPVEARGHFNRLLQTPEFAQNPLGAYDEAERLHNIDKQHGELVKAGVPIEKIEKGKFYSPVEFESAVIQAKTPKGGDPRMTAAKEHFDMLTAEERGMLDAGLDQIPNPAFEAGDKTAPATIPNPEYLNLKKEKADAYKFLSSGYRNLYAPAPAVAPEVEKKGVPPAPPAPTAPPIPVEQTIDLSKVPFAQIEQKIGERKEKAKIQEEVGKAWNDAQIDLEKKLAKAFPGNFEGTNYSKLRRLAEAIVSDEYVPGKGGIAYDESGYPLGVSIVDKTLEDLGLPMKGEAFTEPGSGRKTLGIGNQAVPNDELLKVWAKNYLERSPVTTQPYLQPSSPESVKIQNSLLEGVGLKP